MRVAVLAILAVALFTVAAGCGGDEATVAVPYLVGLKEPLASEIATDTGFEVQVERAASNGVPPGFVYSQNPREGSMLAEGATLTIRVSSG